MTEEIITALSKIRGLRVISRNSAMTLKGTRKTTREIGQLLNVRHVLEGSVRKAGNNLRITAQLIDAATDGHLWAERYAGTLDDVFDIQEKVARAITDALQVKLSPVEQQRPDGAAGFRSAGARVLPPGAARDALRTRESLEEGRTASSTRPRHARRAPASLRGAGAGPLLGPRIHLEPREEALGQAAEYTRRVEAWTARTPMRSLPSTRRFTGSQVQAIRHFEDAVAANPGDVDSLWYLAWSYSFHAGKPAAGPRSPTGSSASIRLRWRISSARGVPSGRMPISPRRSPCSTTCTGANRDSRWSIGFSDAYAGPARPDRGCLYGWPRKPSRENAEDGFARW